MEDFTFMKDEIYKMIDQYIYKVYDTLESYIVH